MDEMNQVTPPTDERGGFVAEIRDFLGSNRVLIMAIILIASIVLMISGSIVGSKTLLVQYAQLLEDYGVDAEFLESYYEMINTLGSGSSVSALVGAIIGNLPLILTFAGFMMIWSSAKNRTASERMETSGFTLLKVLNIIGIVGYALLALVLLLAVFGIAVFGAVGLGSLDSVGTTIASVFVGVFIVFVVLGLAIIGLYIAKNVGLNNTITRLENVVNGVYSEKKVSGFAAVMLIIAGVLGAMGALGSIASANPFSIFGELLRAAYFIMLGVNINALKNIINSYNG
ncbi:MAG: hypothetical protein J6Z46_09625 [Lachnospiraceae bacterium]|nr:hypothetical protein [Lachnospiraceae bacterium]